MINSLLIEEGFIRTCNHLSSIKVLLLPGFLKHLIIKMCGIEKTLSYYDKL